MTHEQLLQSARQAHSRSLELQAWSRDLIHTSALNLSTSRDRVDAFGRITALRREVEDLRKALDSRSVIEQAKGILMATHRYDSEAAFQELVRRSQHQNRKLRDVAAELVAQRTHPSMGQRPR